jgi:hypothetical protein
LRRRSVEFCKRYKWEGEREDIIAGEMEMKSGKREVDMTGGVLQDGEAQYMKEERHGSVQSTGKQRRKGDCNKINENCALHL